MMMQPSSLMLLSLLSVSNGLNVGFWVDPTDSNSPTCTGLPNIVTLAYTSYCSLVPGGSARPYGSGALNVGQCGSTAGGTTSVSATFSFWQTDSAIALNTPPACTTSKVASSFSLDSNVCVKLPSSVTGLGVGSVYAKLLTTDVTECIVPNGGALYYVGVASMLDKLTCTTSDPGFYFSHTVLLNGNTGCTDITAGSMNLVRPSTMTYGNPFYWGTDPMRARLSASSSSGFDLSIYADTTCPVAPGPLTFLSLPSNGATCVVSSFTLATSSATSFNHFAAKIMAAPAFAGLSVSPTPSPSPAAGTVAAGTVALPTWVIPAIAAAGAVAIFAIGVAFYLRSRVLKYEAINKKATDEALDTEDELQEEEGGEEEEEEEEEGGENSDDENNSDDEENSDDERAAAAEAAAAAAAAAAADKKKKKNKKKGDDEDEAEEEEVTTTKKKKSSSKKDDEVAVEVKNPLRQKKEAEVVVVQKGGKKSKKDIEAQEESESEEEEKPKKKSSKKSK